MDELDDDWLAGPSDAQGAREDPLVDREWEKIQNKYNDAGYREGITDGKLSTLQVGFDEGFALSVPPSRTLGILRGHSNALLQHLLTTHASPEVIDGVRELIRDLGRVKRVDILPIDHERIAHEREDEAALGETFELDTTDKREMEGLEDALGGLGQRKTEEGRREGELLGWLEARLGELEEKALRG